MKKSLIITIVLSIALSSPVFLAGQNSLKLRISGNITTFINEPQGKEVLYPEVTLLNDSLYKLFGPILNYTNKGGLGFEAEIMNSLSDKVWLGFEISSDLMTGENDYPGFYNFQFTDLLQLHATAPDTIYTYRTNYPLKYRTSLINFVGNVRFYPIPKGRFRPFVKVSAGLSLVATELSLKTTSVWMRDSTLTYGPPVLYARGTSNANKGRIPAFSIGGGIGFEFQLTGKIAVYADGTYRLVNSDILDGRPNYDWNDKTGLLTHFTTWSATRKISIGLVYTLSDNFSVFGRGGGGGKGKEGGKIQHPFLPFYKIKPR